MAEKIDLGELVTKSSSVKKDTFVMHALCELLGSRYTEILPDGCRTIEVEVKLNGHEVQFSELIASLYGGYERAIKSEALSLVQEKLGNLVDTVERVKREVEDTARDTLGIDWETR